MFVVWIVFAAVFAYRERRCKDVVRGILGRVDPIVSQILDVIDGVVPVLDIFTRIVDVLRVC